MADFGTAVFTAVLNNSQLLTASKQSNAALMGIGAGLSRVGSGLTQAVSVPIAAMAGAAVFESVKVERAWDEVRATYNLTGKQAPAQIEKLIAPTGQLGKAVTNLSLKYGLERVQVINLLGTLSQMGFTGKKATGALTQGLEFAVAAGIPLEDGLSTSIALVSTFGLNNEQLRKSLRGLNKVENDTAASGEDLAAGLRRAGAAAAGLVSPAFSAEEAIAATAAGMAVFRKGGQETMRSGDALRAIFQRIYTTGPKVNKIFDKMGVSVSDANGKSIPFPKLLQNIANNWDKLTEAQQKAFTKQSVGIEFGPLFGVLIRDMQKAKKGTSEFANTMKKYQDVAGGTAAYDRELAIRQETLGASFGRVRAAVDLLNDTMQPLVKDLVKPLVEWVAQLIGKLALATPKTQKMAIVIALVAAAVGPVVLLMGVLVAIIGALLGPMGAIIGVIALIALGVKTFSERTGALRETLMDVWKVVKSNLLVAWEQFHKGITRLMPLLKFLGVTAFVVIIGAVVGLSVALRFLAILFMVIATTVGWVAHFIASIFKWLYHLLVGGSIIPDLVSGIIMWFNRLKTVITAVINVIRAVIVTVWNGIKAYFEAWWGFLQAVFTVALIAIRAVLLTQWNVIKAVTFVIWTAIKTFFTIWWAVVKGIFAVALAILSGNIGRVWKTIRDVTSRVWKTIRDAISTAITKVKEKISTTVDAIKRVWSDAWNDVKSVIQTVMDTVTGIIERAVGVIEGIWDRVSGVVGKITGAAGKLRDLAGKLPGFSSGGLVGGAGNADTVTANLTPGEFVVRKRMVKRFGVRFFAALNAGKIPGATVPTPRLPAPAEMAASLRRIRPDQLRLGRVAPIPVEAGADSRDRRGDMNVTIISPARQRVSESYDTALKRVAYAHGWEK